MSCRNKIKINLFLIISITTFVFLSCEDLSWVEYAKLYTLIQHIEKEEIKPQSETNQKPLPPNTTGYTKPVKMFAYVEVNDHNILNIPKIVLKESRIPVFDYVIIFAPNMNWDRYRRKRYIHFNSNVQPILRYPELYIKPLQERFNIKVLATLLPNHQGVGYSNFESKNDAYNFVMKEVKYYTDVLGLDGWDIDEEYAKYGPVLKGAPIKSYYYYMTSMKEIMPDKLLTHYNFDASSVVKSFQEAEANPADYIDYAWGTSPHLKDWDFALGLPPDRMGVMSLDKDNEQHFFENELGVFVRFNILRHSYNIPDMLNHVTLLLYGEEVEFVGDFIEKPEPIDVPEDYDAQVEGILSLPPYYLIGDTGPAGGKVFYDKGSYSDGWRYLEAAPSDQGTSDQGRYEWGLGWYEWGGYGTTIGTGTGIGSGKSNTEKIVARLGSGNYAAKICYDLSLGGYDDWFLPSKDELNELYKQERTPGRRFLSSHYWSSSEDNSIYTWYQYFFNGDQSGVSKSYDECSVWAVRAF